MAETCEGRRAEKIERYSETSRGSSERKRYKEKEHIEVDVGADAKTTTKMRKRKNKRRKKKRRKIKTQTWLRRLRIRGFSQRLETPTRFPTSAAHARTSR